MKYPKAPIEPRKPYIEPEPREPVECYVEPVVKLDPISNIDFMSYFDDDFKIRFSKESLKSLLEIMPDDSEFCIGVQPDIDYYGHYNHRCDIDLNFLKIEEEVREYPGYKDSVRRYKLNVKKHQQKQEKYKQDLIKYDEDMKKYREEVKQYNIDYAKYQLECLEKEKKKLEKQLKGKI